MSFNVKSLEDSARDVDPDLRYMALEDFQKSLNNPKIQVKAAATFVPLLFQLLYDPVVDVQNQAVRAFAPLVRHVDDQEMVKVISRLYTEAHNSPEESKFTTSVPSLALRSILQNSHTRFSKQLARVTVDMILPQILLVEIMTLSRIEILIDLVKSLGSSLFLEEICAIRRALMVCAFAEPGIVSKRSIVALDVLLYHVGSACLDQLRLQQQFYDSIFMELIVLREKLGLSLAADRTMFTLSLAVLSHVGKSKVRLLSKETVDSLIATIVLKLQLSKLELEEGVEDLDINQLAEENVIRDDILSCLSFFVLSISYEGFIESYLPPIIRILDLFIGYNPLASQRQDDSESEHYDDINFSDDDEIEQDELDSADGLASKLRVLALVVFGNLLSNKFLVLEAIFENKLIQKVVDAVCDKVSLVSNEAIANVVNLLRLFSESKIQPSIAERTEQLYEVFTYSYLPLIEKQIFDFLFTPEELYRFSYLEALAETLIATMSSRLSQNFIEPLLARLNILSVSLNSHPELIGLYEVILDTYPLDQIPSFNFVLGDLADSLKSQRAHSSSISKYLQVCKIFYGKKPLSSAQAAAANRLFFPVLAERVNSRQYSSDVRQQLLSNLSELLIQIPITEENQKLAISTFSESLNFEVTVSNTIDCLSHICEHNPQLFDSMQLSYLIIEKLGAYLGSGDASLYGNSLSLLLTIFDRTTYMGCFEVIEVLSKKILDLLKNTTDLHLIYKAFYALGYILKLQAADAQSVKDILSVVAHFISLDTDDIRSGPLDFLAINLAVHNSIEGKELYLLATSKLDLSKFLTARFIAVIVEHCGLTNEIRKIEESLISILQSKDILPSSHFVFCIHLLGCISARSTVRNFAYEDFLSIINDSPNETVALAAARALGLSIFSDFGNQLPVLLNCFQELSDAKDSKKSLLLVSIKQVLRQDAIATHGSTLPLIWVTIVNAISHSNKEMEHDDVSVLKLAGEILSTVATLDPANDYQRRILQCFDSAAVQEGNNSLVYVMIVVTKQLLSDSLESFDEKIIARVVSHLPKQNLDLKLAIISTILAGVYNKSSTIAAIANDVILPLIFDELGAKEEFKKVIQMGPYKYVVDEGLEVRKLSYELLDAMISISDTPLQDQIFRVDKAKILEILAAKGLNDSEDDIINLAVGNLVHIIQIDHSYLTQISNMHELIQSLSKVLSRNLRSKATAQEAESYGDTLRAIIKLSKVINNALVSDSALTSEWSSYYNNLETRHQLLFHATV